MSFVIVIPTKNEAIVLADNIARLRDYLQSYPSLGAWRICIADNGSTDQTVAVAERLAVADRRITFFHLDEPGRGRALAKAFDAATEDVLCYMDADLSVGLLAVPYLLGTIKRGADVVYGSRFSPVAVVDRSLLREVTSRGYNTLARLVVGLRAKDAQCGFKAIRREAWQLVRDSVRHPGWFFDTELLRRSEMMGLKVTGIPVNWVETPDPRRKSTVDIPVTVRGYLNDLWTFRRQLRQEWKAVRQGLRE